jgi:two-component system response regulator TctD
MVVELDLSWRRVVPLDTCSVLLVEDDEASRRALGAALRRRGCSVCLATTVAEAKGRLRHGLEPDVVLLDLMLPDGDGREVLREVRQRGLDAKVAVCTGVADPECLSGVVAMGPNAVFTKPLDLAGIEAMCAGA